MVRAVYCHLFCLVLAVIIFSAKPCHSYEPITDKHLETVTLQLKWKHQFQFAGYYAAKEKGFYEKAGLDVKILEAQDGVESTDQVVKGEADFGVAMSDLILHKAKGYPVVALASIFQHSPLIILTPKTSRIENIHAFKGKRIAMEGHSAELLAYFNGEGVSLKEIDIFPHEFSVASLISGKVDAISAYSTDEPFMLLSQGIEYNTFSPRAGGIDFYGDTLFTSEKKLAENPELVSAFLSASLEGWQYALDNTEEIIDLILSGYTRRHSREHLLFEAQMSKRLIMADVVELGYMNKGRWQHIARIFEKLGMIDSDVSLEGFVYDPHPQTDYTWVKWVVGATAGTSILVGIGALFLLFFNKKLRVEIDGRKKIEQALNNSEKKYKALFNNAQVALFRNRISDGKLLEINERYANLAGYSTVEDCLAEFNASDAWVDANGRNEFLAVLQENGFVVDYETKIIRRDGTAVWISFSATIFSEQGFVEGSIVDITERKQAEQERDTLQANLIQTQKMESIGTLTRGIAHDFNNIMGIILGNTELALEDVSESNPAHSYLEEIKKASLRAANIVRQLLNFSRITEQKLEPVQIAFAINDALKFLRSTIPATITIEQDIQVTNETILADSTQINQIMMNLCINASHAMEQTGGNLTIRVENALLESDSSKDYPDLKSGRYVKVMVTDTGSGIDPIIIERIFDPYFTTKGVGKGSGMGLSVVHGIVKNHGGAITVDSSPGNGTKFSMLFPLAKETSAIETQTTQQIPRGSETILFVDDEISIVTMVQKMFERLGYQVETDTAPKDALDRFGLNPDHFDLVITDMTMSQMTGVKLSEQLMAIRPDIPIILCTGHSDMVDEEKAKGLGLAALLMKPINMLEIAQTIRKVLDKT